MNYDELMKKIEEIPFEVNVTIEGDKTEGQITISNSDNYIDSDRDDLQQAYEDFKRTNEQLKEHGIRSSYDLNQPPNSEWPDWELIIPIAGKLGAEN